MKELLIYRHAKTHKASGDTRDFDRELMPRGVRQCEEMAEKIQKKKLSADLVISSNAVRALQTAETTLAAMGLPLKTLAAPELYGSDAEDYLAVVAERAGEAERVMVIGHNPACEELLERLTGEHFHLGTAAIVRVRLSIDSWSELSEDAGGTLMDHLEAEAK